MQEITLTEENFIKEVAEQSGYVLVDFWATWCGPCQMLAPLIREIAEECPQIKVGKVNVDEQMGLAQVFKVTSIPTLILFKDGKPIRQQVGYIQKDQIKKMWEA